ncbi:hypothetical protein H5410_059202, partial [Solanum commersonii]
PRLIFILLSSHSFLYLLLLLHNCNGFSVEQLLDGVINEIFGKTKCAKSMVRCAKLFTNFEPLVLDVHAHTLYLPIIIRQRFEIPVSVPVSSVPPSSNRGLFQIIWLFIKLPFSVCIKFANKLFLHMVRRTKTGNWLSSIQDIAISYTRNNLNAMMEEMSGHAGDCVEFRGRDRRWIVNVVRISEKNVELNEVILVIFKGEDCAVEDRMIIRHTFEEDLILFEAALRAYDNIHTVF